MTSEDEMEYPRVNWKQKREMLNKIYGDYNPNKTNQYQRGFSREEIQDEKMQGFRGVISEGGTEKRYDERIDRDSVPFLCEKPQTS